MVIIAYTRCQIKDYYGLPYELVEAFRKACACRSQKNADFRIIDVRDSNFRGLKFIGLFTQRPSGYSVVTKLDFLVLYFRSTFMILL
jgi:hypothetical protein